MTYVIDESYYDYETGRRRVAVLCSTTRCYYFSNRYGKKAAIALCNRLNKIDTPEQVEFDRLNCLHNANKERTK